MNIPTLRRQRLLTIAMLLLSLYIPPTQAAVNKQKAAPNTPVSIAPGGYDSNRVAAFFQDAAYSKLKKYPADNAFMLGEEFAYAN